MRKMRVVYGLLILLFCTNYWCSFAFAATDGIERGLLQNVVVAPILNNNTWTQAGIRSIDNPDLLIHTFYNWHVVDNVGHPYPAGCLALSVAQIVRFFEHPKMPMLEGKSLVGEYFPVRVFEPGEWLPAIWGGGTVVNTRILGSSGGNGSYTRQQKYITQSFSIITSL